MKLIGIDPGTNGGIAIFDTELKTWRLVKMPSEEDFREFCKTFTGARVAIEKQQAHQADRNSPSFFGLQKLILRTERMTEYMRAVGVDIVEVHPLSWQSKFRGEKGEEKPARKKRYQSIACQLVGQKVALWGSDAVLIAYWLGQKSVEAKPVKQEKLF